MTDVLLNDLEMSSPFCKDSMLRCSQRKKGRH